MNWTLFFRTGPIFVYALNMPVPFHVLKGLSLHAVELSLVVARAYCSASVNAAWRLASFEAHLWDIHLYRQEKVANACGHFHLLPPSNFSCKMKLLFYLPYLNTIFHSQLRELIGTGNSAIYCG